MGACATSVLCSLLRAYFYIQCLNNPARQDLRVALGAQRWVLEPLHVLVLTGILALVGSCVAALVVLEFSLRAISTLLSFSKRSSSQARAGSRPTRQCWCAWEASSSSSSLWAAGQTYSTSSSRCWVSCGACSVLASCWKRAGSRISPSSIERHQDCPEV